MGGQMTTNLTTKQTFDLKGIAYLLIITNSLLGVIAGTIIGIALSLAGVL